MRARLAWPSALTCLAVIPAALAVVRSVTVSQSEGDYWWHVAVGNWISERGAVPHQQWISWLADKPAWITQEWLGEVLMALVHRTVGPLGSVWMFAVVSIAIWLSFLSLLRITLRPKLRPLEAGILMLAAFVVAAPVWGPRLQLFGLLWSILTVRLAYGYLAAGERRGIWFLPIILVLWSNTHTGSVMLAVPLLFGLIVGEWLDHRRLPDALFLGIVLLSFVAIVLNPYGTASLTYPFQTIFSAAAQTYIQEWRAPDFQQLQFRGLEAAILIGPFVLPFGIRHLDMKSLVISMGLLLMSLQSGRHVGFFALIGLALLAPGLVEGVRTLLDRYGYRATEFRRGATVALRLAASAVVVAAILVTASMWADGAAQDRVTARNQPVAAATAIEPYLAEHPTTRIFAEYQWGGYLYLRLGTQTGLYGASEAFTDDRFAEAARVFIVTIDPGLVLDDWHVDMVMLDPSSPLGYWLAQSPAWRQLYRDDVAVAFVRT